MTSRRAGRTTAAVLVVALLAAACGDDQSGADPTTTTETPTSSSTTTTSSTTTSSTTSTTSSTTTTTTTTTMAAGEPVCPGSGGLPPQAENNSLAGGDVNGDGEIDTVHSYTIGDPIQVGAWWIQVSFAAGGGSALQVLDPGSALSGVRVFDGFDVSGNGKQEFFALVGAGASVQLVALFEVVDCDLRRITVDGEPTEFPVGASLNFVSGLECTDADGNGANDFVITYGGQRLNDSPEFEVTAVQYALQDGELQFILADGIGGNENDADFGRLSSADCPGLEVL